MNRWMTSRLRKSAESRRFRAQAVRDPTRTDVRSCSKLARVAARHAVVPHSPLYKWLILRSRAR